MTVYQYKSPVGLFRILPHKDRWALWLEDDVSGYYQSPVAAADDVYTQTTGFSEWDRLKLDDIPTDLSEWEKLQVHVR